MEAEECRTNSSYEKFSLLQFETFVDWRQCAAVMQREAVTVMPSCSGGGGGGGGGDLFPFLSF